VANLGQKGDSTKNLEIQAKTIIGEQIRVILNNLILLSQILKF
jgi:hypothetical protein